MAQVRAAIVVSQAGNAAPVGYVSGSRDGLVLNQLVTLTNANNGSVTSHEWAIEPAIGRALGDYNVAGQGAASCTLTPPSPGGYGDLYVRLTVRGAPFANGAPNIDTAEALLGVRGSLAGYSAGVPLPHPRESSLGGRVTFAAIRGVIGRIVEALRALYEAVKAGGGGGVSELVGDVTSEPDGSALVTTVVGLAGTPLGPAIVSPIDGQLVAYTSASGGQVTLTPAPTAPGDGPRWTGSAWAVGPVDAAMVGGRGVTSLVGYAGTARALVTDEDGLLTLGPAPTRDGQRLHYSDTDQFVRYVGGEVIVTRNVTGVYALTDDEVDADVIRVQGTGAYVRLTFPSRPGRRWTVVSELAGGGRLAILNGSDVACDILPGEARLVCQVGGLLRGDDDAIWLRWSRSYANGAGATINTRLGTIPGGYEIVWLVQHEGVATGGTVRGALGVASGDATLMALSTAHSAALQRGRKASELGTAFAGSSTEDAGLSYSDADREVWSQLIVSAAGMTGTVEVTLLARRVRRP